MQQKIPIVVVLVGLSIFSAACFRNKSSKEPNEPAKINTSLRTYQSPRFDSEWLISDSASPMNGVRTITAILDAEPDSNASLVIRCSKKKTEAFVNLNDIVDNGRVRIKIDNAGAVTETWMPSDGDGALFTRSPIALVGELASAKQLLFEYSPFQKSPVDIRFNVSKLNEHLQEISQSCRWDEIIAKEKSFRAKISSHVYHCNNSITEENGWCWSDPNSLFNDTFLVFRTKQEALNDAMEKARLGLAFKDNKSSP